MRGFVKNRWLTGEALAGYSEPMEMLDAPEIRRMERWGEGAPEAEPRCPVCGQICEWLYVWKEREIVGCENCVQRRDAWQEGGRNAG